MTLSVEIEVSAIYSEGYADIVQVSSDRNREFSVVIAIGEEMALVDGDDLISAIRRAMLNSIIP